MRKTLSLVLLCLTLACTLQAQKYTNGGLFFDKEDVPMLRERFALPLFAELRKEMESIDRAAERKFMKSEVRYNDHLYDIARIGNLAQKMAFYYLYTNDEDAADLAQECIRVLMRFPRWDYFIEGGKTPFGLQRAPNTALAVVLVVELLGDKVKKKERDEWLRIMGERGTEACFVACYGMRYPDRVEGWAIDRESTYLEHRPDDSQWDLSRWPIILNTINLKAIPASVLAISALTYQKYLGEDDNTRRWLEQGMYSVGTFKDIYKNDGSYDEGISYANYTTLHLLQAISAIKRVTDSDLSDMLNWQGYSEFLLEMNLATHADPADIVNFSDAGKGSLSSPPFWIAKHTKDPLAQWFGQNLSRAHDVWSVLWLDNDVKPVAPTERHKLWQSSLDWIVGRTGYGVDDFVVAMRSGEPSNHEHADRNSIIVKAFGEKLVVDPYRPPYTKTDSSWVLRTLLGHSGMLIDGKGHQYIDGSEGTNSSKAAAAIIRKGERNGFMFWTSDATPAYKMVLPDVKSATRTIIMLNQVPAVLVVEKVIKNQTPSKIQARFYGDNYDRKGALEAHAKGFKIMRPNAVLNGVSASGNSVNYAAGTLPIAAAKKDLYPFIDVGTAQASLAPFLLTVLMPEAGVGGQTEASINYVAEGNYYDVTVQRGIEKWSCRVFDEGPVPEFSVNKN